MSFTLAGFLIDEDLPHSLAHELQQLGFSAQHVREVELGGHPDHEVLAYALSHEMAVLSSDVGFSQLHLASRSHFGIIIGRFHETLPIATRKRLLIMAATSIASHDLLNALLIVQPGSLRRHRKK